MTKPDEDRVADLHYGLHKATNEYRKIKHAVLVGVPQAPLTVIKSMVYGTKKEPMHADVSAADMETYRMSRIIGDINQAVGRTAIREMTPEGDVPIGCTIDIIASSWGPLGFKYPYGTLRKMFPGATIVPWEPRAAQSKRVKYKEPLIDAIVGLVGDKAEVTTTSEALGRMVGVTRRTVQRRLNNGELPAQLKKRGIAIEAIRGGGGGVKVNRTLSR
jgi:hypothetical protein